MIANPLIEITIEQSNAGCEKNHTMLQVSLSKMCAVSLSLIQNGSTTLD